MGEAWDIPSHSPSPISTTTAKVAPSRASLRPPIFNPYDRFTQPEFDAWIGDITNSLRHALRHEVEPDVDSRSRPSGSWKTIPDESSGSCSADGHAQSPASTEGRDEESAFEDSFAHIASRKAKGKARDPREGPGLGLKDQPIELLSDSEEEGEVVDSLGGDAVYSENSDESSGDGSSGETDCADSELAEGREASPGQPGTSTQHIVSSLSREDAGNDQEVAEYSDAEARDVGDEGNLQLPEHMRALRDDHRNGDKVDIMQDGREGTEDEFSIPSQRTFSFDVELSDPWDGPRTFAEDYYSGGDRLAPGLTPNHLTPVARSPVSALVPDLPNAPDADVDEDGLSVSSSVLSTSLSPRLRDTVGGDKIIRSLQPSTAVAASVNDERGIDELADVTENAAEDAGCEVVWSAENVGVIEPTRISKESHASHLTSADWKTRGQNSDQRHGTIWVSPSDDERTDADGEEDEEKLIGVAPLGTSDLDIRDDWGAADKHKDIDDTSDEEDELQTGSSQSADDVANTTALTLSHSSKTVNPSSLNGPEAPLADPPTPTLASTFQLTDADSFGDLPVSLPPSETPSPVPGGRSEAYELQQHSIEQLFADLERGTLERHTQTPKPPASHAGQSAAEPAHAWASQELENILSGEISVDDNAADVSESAMREDMISQVATFSTQRLGYIVEESKFETDVLLPADDFDDALSIPPDLTEGVEMIQQYEVEEPKTDGRLTEEPEITIKMSSDEDGSAAITSSECTAPAILDKPVPPVPPTEGLSYSSGASARDLSQAGLSSTVPTIPAPIVADPSVPDPVSGDSSRASPVINDSPDVSGLSILPLSLQKVYGLDVSQLSSGTSGLFTPAQRSDGGTPVLLEDETAEPPTALHNGADKSPATPSTPPQAHTEPSSIERLDGGSAENGDILLVDDVIESSESAFPDDRHLGVEAVGVDDQNPVVHATQADDIIPTPLDRSAKLILSPLHKVDNPLVKDILPRIPPKESPAHPDELAANGECLPGSLKVVEDDEDADGEADPDYSPADRVAEEVTLGNAHQPVDEDGELASSKVGNDIPSSMEVAPESETHSTSAQVRKEDPKLSGDIVLGSLVDSSATLRDSTSSGKGDEGELTIPAQSDVKASHASEHTNQAIKRKRGDPNSGSTRITRSQSGVGAKRGGKKGSVSSSRRRTATSEKAKSERADASIDGDAVDDDASEIASVSSGTSVMYHLLRTTSRAGSVVSSASGDVTPSASSSGLARVVPLVHSHGLLYHHHGWPAPPPLMSPSPSTRPHQVQDPQSGPAKAKSPTPTFEPSTPSLRRAPSINSPVTRSNCRFHKISLPRGDNGVRAYFVVPGCALGDITLMRGEDIKDEGFSNREDHKRMLPNVETLELSPYLVGVLRQLVGVDLLREQQEIFYLPSEEEKPRKRGQRDAVESLRHFRRQSLSSGGPSARELSPRPSEASQIGATPSRSVSGSAVSSSTREEGSVHIEDSALSDLESDDDPDKERRAKRHKASATKIRLPLADTLTDGEPSTSAVPEHTVSEGKEPAISRQPPATRKGKRKTLSHDAAAYKPSGDDVQDEEVEETQTRRNNTRKTTKRSRTMEGTPANAPRTKKTRLSRGVSLAGASTVDS